MVELNSHEVPLPTADGCDCGGECLPCAEFSNHRGCVRRLRKCPVNEGLGGVLGGTVHRVRFT